MIQDKQGIELAMMRKHADFEEKDILEIGCGVGRASAMIAPMARSLVAIDTDQERLEIARENYPGIDFRIGSGEELNFPPGTFDIVAFTFSLHHQNSSKAMSEARRVLRPGGKIMVIEPAIEGDMHSLFNIFNPEDSDIIAAQEAITHCGMEVVSQIFFDIEYIFDGVQDVHEYFFDSYKMPSNPDYLARMNSVIGPRINERPLLLRESVNLWVLVKPQ